MAKFIPSIYECQDDCKDKIFSSFPGEWVCCSCFSKSNGKTGGYVDQTQHYIRIGGNMLYVGDKVDAN